MGISRRMTDSLCTRAIPLASCQAVLTAALVLQGRRCGDLYRYFPDGIVLGLWNRRSRRYFLLPPEDRVVNADDLLIIMRSTSAARADYGPALRPHKVDIGEHRPSHLVCQAATELRESLEQCLAAQGAMSCSGLGRCSCLLSCRCCRCQRPALVKLLCYAAVGHSSHPCCCRQLGMGP